MIVRLTETEIRTSTNMLHPSITMDRPLERSLIPPEPWRWVHGPLSGRVLSGNDRWRSQFPDGPKNRWACGSVATFETSAV